MKNLIRFGFVFLLFAGLASAQGRALKAEDYYTMKNVGGPEISPNGRWVTFPVTTRVESDNQLRQGNDEDDLHGRHA